MPARLLLFHDVMAWVSQACPHLRKTAHTRLALLMSGILAAQSCVQLTVAEELLHLAFTRAQTLDAVSRRLRRILNDTRPDAATCYEPALRVILDWVASWTGWPPSCHRDWRSSSWPIGPTTCLPCLIV